MTAHLDPDIHRRHNDHRFRAPTDLCLNRIKIRRVLIVGSCLSQGAAIAWKDAFGVECDHIVENNFAELPETPPHPVPDYDFQVVMPALRPFMPENAYLRLAYDDEESAETLFEHSV